MILANETSVYTYRRRKIQYAVHYDSYALDSGL
jgi:hypothetical protein